MAKTNNILSFDIVSPEGKAKALAQRVKTRRLEMNLTQEGFRCTQDCLWRPTAASSGRAKFPRTGCSMSPTPLDALNDFDQVFAAHKYATLDEAINASQNNRKRGKRNE